MNRPGRTEREGAGSKLTPSFAPSITRARLGFATLRYGRAIRARLRDAIQSLPHHASTQQHHRGEPDAGEQGF